MRILGIDYGDKKIGLALSDPLQKMAFAFETCSPNELINKIPSWIQEKKIVRMVMGLPKNMDNTEGFQTQITRQFSDRLLQVAQIELVFWDERLSSRMASNALKYSNMSIQNKKQKIHQVAACHILQNYLDSL